MYRAIAMGFAFFTIATILGALWAAEAWGGYWSWDPKETWALIVWLNYAAWLHMRLMKGLRGRVAAWWALIGLVVTTFAFLGVNMFLSGPALLRRVVSASSRQPGRAPDSAGQRGSLPCLMSSATPAVASPACTAMRSPAAERLPAAIPS